MEHMAVTPQPLALRRKDGTPADVPASRVVNGWADVAVDALIQRAQGGDREAFTELMRRYYDAVMRQVLLYVGADRASADDVAQETWWRIARALGGFSGRAGFYTWACRIARNEAIRRGRKMRMLPVLPEPVQDTGEDRDRAEVVHAALRRLPEKFRQPLILELWEDKSLREIGIALGLPEGTVKSRLFRAREKFREIWLEMNADEQG
jgi:RNA polymerase sigma-70 factor (ECF subfamily)